MSESHQCKDCSATFSAPKDFEARMAYRCPECASERWALIPGKMAGISVPDGGWNRTAEGHYCSQLEKGPSTKKSAWAHVRSVREMKEKLATMGMVAHKDGY